MYNMYKNITSTDLKQHTRVVLQEIEDKKEPIIINTYNQARAVLVNYEEWKQKYSASRPKVEDIKKYMFSSKVKDTTKFIRKMRDAEVDY